MRTIIDVSMRVFWRETVSKRLRYRFTAAPYPDRPKPGDAKKADGVSARACERKQPFLIELLMQSADRLQDARKIQDVSMSRSLLSLPCIDVNLRRLSQLLASLGSLPPSNNASAPPAAPSAPTPAPRASPFVPPNLPNYMGNRVNVPPALPQMRMPDQRSLPPQPPVFNANAHQPSPQPPPAAPVISPSVFAALQQFNASGTASAPQQAGPSSIPRIPQTAFRPPNLPLSYPAQAPAPPTPSNTAGDTTQAMTQLLALLVSYVPSIWVTLRY
jgi:hypothetical protein